MNPLLLFLLVSFATGAAAQTVSLETLYGTWETTPETTFEAVRNDGMRAEFTTLYAALEISEAALTDLSVSAQTGGGMPKAPEIRYPYRAEGLDLFLDDGIRVRLRPVGERLGVTWSQGDETLPETLMDRAVPPVVPEALRGDWTGTFVEDGDAEFPLRLDARHMTFGSDAPIPVRFAGNLLLATDDEMDVEAGVVRTHRVYAIRMDGEALVLDDRRSPMRLVQP